MTEKQKTLWNMLPPGEWILRDEVHSKYGKRNFQLALSVLYTNNLVELKFIEGVQYMRRKTIEEISKLSALK